MVRLSPWLSSTPREVAWLSPGAVAGGVGWWCAGSGCLQGAWENTLTVRQPAARCLSFCDIEPCLGPLPGDGNQGAVAPAHGTRSVHSAQVSRGPWWWVTGAQKSLPDLQWLGCLPFPFPPQIQQGTGSGGLAPPHTWSPLLALFPCVLFGWTGSLLSWGVGQATLGIMTSIWPAHGWWCSPHNSPWQPPMPDLSLPPLVTATCGAWTWVGVHASMCHHTHPMPMSPTVRPWILSGVGWCLPLLPVILSWEGSGRGRGQREP